MIFVLLYFIIGMWFAGDVLRAAPTNLEAPDWFIAVLTTLLWPLYIIIAIITIIKLSR